MSLQGMCRHTGRPLSGIEHLVQSIADILSTPLGSRRERPDYGSRIPRMVDQPVTAGWVAAVQSEAARAIARWEPRVTVHSVRLLSMVEGRPSFSIDVEYDGESRVIEIRA